MPRDDNELRKLIDHLLDLLKRNEPKSEVVKKFVQQHHDWDEFVDLAAVCILAAERASPQHSSDEHAEECDR